MAIFLGEHDGLHLGFVTRPDFRIDNTPEGK